MSTKSLSTSFKYNKEADEVVTLRRDKSPTLSSGSDNISRNESFLSRHITRSASMNFFGGNTSTSRYDTVESLNCVPLSTEKPLKYPKKHCYFIIFTLISIIDKNRVTGKNYLPPLVNDWHKNIHYRTDDWIIHKIMVRCCVIFLSVLQNINKV